MTASLRVLLVTDWLSGRGGSEAYTACVRAGLMKSGDEVRLLTSSAGTAGDGTADFIAYGSHRPVAQTFMQLINPFAMSQAREAARTFRPDVVLVVAFAYQLSPAVLWSLRDVPTVMMILDYKIVCPVGSKLLPDGGLCHQRAGIPCWRSGCVSLPQWLRDQLRYAEIGAAVNHTHRILACSRYVQRELQTNGIDAECLPLAVAEPGGAYSRRPAADPEFLFCGRFSVEKGAPLLVRAFARLHERIPRARLKVVGEGPQRSEIEQTIADEGLGTSVTITGWLDPADVERQFASAWALVAPSLWAEPFGLVAPEAIVRGVPVIASRTGGFAESVEEGVSGLLVPNGDEQTLYEALWQVANGEVFPSHSLDEQVVLRARNAFGVERHLAGLRRYLLEAKSRSVAFRDDPIHSSHARS